MSKSRRPTAAGAGNRRGFTLIELLVVMSVIMLLAALLSPLIRRSISMAVRTQCQTNLRQLGVGNQMYSNNWDMYILPAHYTPHQSLIHAPGFPYWWHGVGRKGGLWPEYVNDPKAFVCPNNDSVNPMAACSYTHNWAPWNIIPNVCPAQRKVQKVGEPQTTITFTESYNPVIWDWLYADGSGSLFPRLLDRHGTGYAKGPNCLYMDGRADFRIRLELGIPDFSPISDHDK